MLIETEIIKFVREASVFNFLILIKLTDSYWQFNGDLSEVLKTKRNDMSYCWSYS